METLRLTIGTLRLRISTVTSYWKFSECSVAQRHRLPDLLAITCATDLGISLLVQSTDPFFFPEPHHGM
eukprot:385787-Amphidinium_carterae.1